MSERILERIAAISPEKRELLKLLLEEEGVDVNQSLIMPQPRESNRFPVSFAQERLWFLDQLDPGSSAYHIPLAMRVNGRLHVPILKQTLAEIVRRHETLRTVFADENGTPIQVIQPDLPLPWAEVDMCSWSETAVTHHILEEAQKPFNLATGPLFRFTLAQRGPEEHIILLTMHHIISDGWSMSVLIREIGIIYFAYLSGRSSPLPPPRLQYADFACWQRQWLQGEKLAAELAYWQKQLAGSPPLLELPTDRPRTAMQTNRGARHLFTLSPQLTAPLKALGRREGHTLFMTLLAAFQTLLFRYTGQTDICIGAPIANRQRQEIEGLVGFFVNTLVMRADLSGAPTFNQVLEQVRETTLDAYAHQDVPFEMLVDRLHVERDLSHTPLFQVMFTLGNTPLKPLTLPGLTFTPLETDTFAAPFDLTLSLAEEAGRLGGALEYNADLFDAATIERMVAHFQTLLAGIVADPDQPITTLPLLTKAEQQLILEEWNDTAVPLPHLCLHQLFEQQVERTPQAIAIIAGRQQLTYEQLNQRANQLAHHLQTLGVGPDTLVGIAVDRSPEMLIGLLGVLKAGGAFLPLDPTYPPDRLAFMIADAQPAVILTIDDLRLSTNHQSSIINLNPDWPTIAQHPTTNLPISQSADSLAYVIYTSGSTGQPKGVAIPHRAVVNHNLAVVEQFKLRPSDRVWQFATINFDAAYEEIFPTWLAGAALVLRQPELPSPGDVCHLIAQEQLTVLDLPTAYWHAWVQELVQSGQALPESLRLVIVGGEKADAQRLKQWQAIAAERVTWLNTYGPTETTVISTLYRPGGVVKHNVPIGRPIANSQLYILDPHLQPVPIGIPGELYIGGAGLARGYLNRPELTAEKFIPATEGRPPLHPDSTGPATSAAGCPMATSNSWAA